MIDKPRSAVYIHDMEGKIDFSNPQNCVCFNLRFATRLMTHYFDGQLKSLGLRSTQGSLLVALNARESWIMSDLAEVLGMERTTLVRNLQPLQRDGWVVADSGHGGRGGPVSLFITDKGRKQMEIFVPAWKTAQQAAVNVLGEERWTAIMNDLRTVALTLDN